LARIRATLLGQYGPDAFLVIAVVLVRRAITA
jgi:hypothetical protein